MAMHPAEQKRRSITLDLCNLRCIVISTVVTVAFFEAANAAVALRLMLPDNTWSGELNCVNDCEKEIAFSSPIPDDSRVSHNLLDLCFAWFSIGFNSQPAFNARVAQITGRPAQEYATAKTAGWDAAMAAGKCLAMQLMEIFSVED